MRALLLVAVLASFATGCADSDCEFACDKAKECGGDQANSTFFGNLSCADICDLSDDLADSLNCESQFDAFFACSASQLPEDGCVPTTVVSCQAENEAYAMCFGSSNQ